MIPIIAFLMLAITSVLSLAGMILLLILWFFKRVQNKSNSKHLMYFKRVSMVFGTTIILNIGLIDVTHILASTPRIVDEDGRIPEESIAELIELDLNGRKQWVSIRSWNKNNPVLLFLAGGPGGTQMAAVRHELSELEKYFVVVNWDQPGSGKSYYAERTKFITVDTYIQDGYALTEYLKDRFAQDKIYLIGESWGSALGIFLANQYPQSYHAMIGTGQMIDFAETEQLDYAKAMELAADQGDTTRIKKLTANGIPPYYGANVTWKSAAYINYLSSYMANHPEIHNAGYNTVRDISSSEYGLLDKINFAWGLVHTFNHVYQQLYDIDMREDYPKLEVPVYFFLGRYDVNAPTTLVEQYTSILDAPEKKVIWFEHSGHSPWINETSKFIKEVVSCFLETER